MTTDTGPAEPSLGSRIADRLERFAAAAGVAARAAGKAIDSYDVTCFVALAMMLAGLTIWFGVGPALTVVGTLVLIFGVAGARSAEAREAEDAARDRAWAGQRPRGE